jgi:hypothetical protein
MQTNPFAALSGISRLLYNHNPFYLISALLVLQGMRLAMAASTTHRAGIAVLAVLCGYMLLLAVVAWLIVRLGKVWDDARTILLVLVLLQTALSACFDRVALDVPWIGAVYLAGGFAFSVLISEGVLASLRIHLAPRYRAPYYLTLALLFSYPVALALLSVHGHDDLMSLAVASFPVSAAAVSLTLLPAARSGGKDEPPSGTPWHWPWFPWPLFVMLAVAVGLRAFWLSAAFEITVGSEAGFRPYLLVPLLLAANVLLLEAGLATGSARLRRVALLLPIGLVLLALPGADLSPTAGRLLGLLSTNIGSPLQMTLWALAAFYAANWWRGLKACEVGLVACLLAASVAAPQTVNLATLRPPSAWPLAALCAVELIVSWRTRSSPRLLIACLTSVLATPHGWQPEVVREHGIFLLVHAAWVLALLLSLVYRDPVARWLRERAWLLVPATAWLAAVCYPFWMPRIGLGVHLGYVGVLALAGWLHWVRGKNPRNFAGALSGAAAVAAEAGWPVREWIDETPLQGSMPWLDGAGLCLLVGLLISVLKGRMLVRLWRAVNAWHAAWAAAGAGAAAPHHPPSDGGQSQ